MLLYKVTLMRSRIYDQEFKNYRLLHINHNLNNEYVYMISDTS